MMVAKAFLALSLVLIVAGTAAAQDAKPGTGGRGGRGGPGGRGGFGGPGGNIVDRLKASAEKLGLSDDQKEKVKDLAKEYEPKFKEAMNKMSDILTPEQKKIREEAMAKAKEGGAGGREAFSKMRDAMKLTDEQKAKQQEAYKTMGELGKEVRDKFEAILTDEQKEKLKAMRPQGGRGGNRGPGGDKKPADKKEKEST